jgi:hypothetical protein
MGLWNQGKALNIITNKNKKVNKIVGTLIFEGNSQKNLKITTYISRQTFQIKNIISPRFRSYVVVTF